MAELFPWQLNSWSELVQRASSNRLPHALLLTGPEGIGKQVFADYLAKGFVCSSPSIEPCGVCKSCQLISHQTHPDKLTLLPEGAANVIKVDAIRQVSHFINETAQQANGKVVVVTQAERLNVQAANALLKSLEEPSGKSLFLLITSQPSQLMPTIRSRCQQLILKAPDIKDSLAWLQAADVDAAVAHELLVMSGGAPLTALEYRASDKLGLWRSWQEDLGAILSSQKALTEVAEGWKGSDPVLILAWWSDWCGKVIKVCAGDQSCELNDLQQRAVSDRMLTPWLAFQLRVQQLRKQLTGAITLNVNLALESLLIEWIKLFRSAERTHR
ncbi:DNA polymerase III subunit delta' [Pokkaliibacter sp. CJK22405]|uniref:DNA polymerase III subunit delta' n=1 Tax=Pokkaliibacter sp. CJK22405 TaxID=3384615 RepID=UPI0039854580